MLTYIVISPNIAEPMSLENVDRTRGPSLRRASSKVFAALTARLKLGLQTIDDHGNQARVLTSSCVPVAERLGQVRHRAVEVIFVVLTTGTLEHGLDPCFHVDQTASVVTQQEVSVGRVHVARKVTNLQPQAVLVRAVVVEGPQSSHVEDTDARSPSRRSRSLARSPDPTPHASQ